MIEVADRPISQSTEPAVIAAANVKGVIRSEATKKLNGDRGPTIHQAFSAPNYSYGEPKTLPYNGAQKIVAAPVESEYPASRRPDIDIIKSTWRRALSALSALKITPVAHTIPHEFPERLPREILKDAIRAWVETLNEFDHITHVIYTEGNDAVSSVIREVLDEGKTTTEEPGAQKSHADSEPTPPAEPDPQSGGEPEGAIQVDTSASMDSGSTEQQPSAEPTDSAPAEASESQSTDDPGQRRTRRQPNK